jgi:hypothetical protein
MPKIACHCGGVVNTTRRGQDVHDALAPHIALTHPEWPNPDDQPKTKTRKTRTRNTDAKEGDRHA